MRIVIEHDSASTPAAGTSGTSVSTDAENAGGAPDASATSSDSSADGGGPPQWLLDAVGRTRTEDQFAPGEMTDASDGGAAPDQD